MASGAVIKVDQAALAHQAFSGHQRERSQDENLVRRVDLRAQCHRQEGASLACLALQLLLILSVSVFEKTHISSALQPDAVFPETPLSSNQLNLFTF